MDNGSKMNMIEKFKLTLKKQDGSPTRPLRQQRLRVLTETTIRCGNFTRTRTVKFCATETFFVHVSDTIEVFHWKQTTKETIIGISCFLNKSDLSKLAKIPQ